ncbi:FUN14 domain-containing protein 2 isoform X5 [Kogia breviceps]|uniref:FUN14 domain-containing protein 2 isoform X5 n=1 Tax=Kogia breviceps TaxID=27615 RepID=UPI0034D184B9
METSTPRAGSQLVPTAARHSASYRTEHLRLSSRDKLAEMAATSQGNFEGNFESLDLAELAKKQPWWRKLFGQESGPSAEKYSVATQLLIGGVTGCVAESSCKHTAWELKGFAQDHEMKCTGFIFQKVGRLAATALGGGFFLLQVILRCSQAGVSGSAALCPLSKVANHTGYIKVDWQRVEKDVKKAKEQLKIRNSNQIPTEVKSKAEEVVSFVKKNVLVTGGFFGGFLLGMAS